MKNLNVGDSFYALIKWHLTIGDERLNFESVREHKISRCEIGSAGVEFYDQNGELVNQKDWGKTLFSTKEDAEKKAVEERKKRFYKVC